MSDVGPTSLDGKRSQTDKQEKLRKEAQYEKDRGNLFVKEQKWDQAVECYNRAIELVSDDAIYYANRGLCHLKKDRLHQAESDCTAAIKLDPRYVKAYQRRAAAREKLGSLRAASRDLETVIKLEPANAVAKRLLIATKQRMATKGGKFKSSPATPRTENKTISFTPSTTITERPDSPPHIQEIFTKVYTREEKKPAEMLEANKLPLTVEENKPSQTLEMKNPTRDWPGATGDGLQVIQPIEKPVHLQSKKPLRLIPIEEVLMDEAKPNARTNERGDSLLSSPNRRLYEVDSSIESSKLANENIKENGVSHAEVLLESNGVRVDSNDVSKAEISKLTAPSTCVQFITDWTNFGDDENTKKAYLNLIAPQRLPSIFQNSLESEMLSDILSIMSTDPQYFKKAPIKDYLKHLTQVKRFTTLAMFLTEKDKSVVNSLLKHCQEVEGCTEQELKDLKNKFEL